MATRRIVESLRRAIRLRCPRCGRGALFRGLFTMHEHCPVCGMLLEREQGYFVGAIYVNYAATVGITIAGFLLLDAYTNLSITTQILLWSAFGIVFPLLFFRYSRSMWLGLEYFFNPESPELRRVR